MASLELDLAHYGYLALIAGTLLAAAGNFRGRKHADWLLRRRPTWNPLLLKTDRLIVKHPVLIGCLGYFGCRHGSTVE
jgi:hypothetical protein